MRPIIVFFIITISISCSSGNNSDSESKTPILPDKVLNVGFLIVDGVYNSELVAPMDIFHHTVFHTDKGMRVFTIAPDSLPLKTFEGLQIIPSYAYKYDSIPTIDVLVVPSAEHSMDTDLDNSELINFVSEKGMHAKFVMSLCDGAFVLAKAGLVDGLESTTFPSDIARYREMFPELKVHENVSFVHDGNLITSAGGAKSYDPALYLVEILYGKKVANGVAAGLVIDWELAKIDHIISNH